MPEQVSSGDAYRSGLCVDCRTKPHSPGRPRCDDCHDCHDRYTTTGGPTNV